jgi:hypothetical protein
MICRSVCPVAGSEAYHDLMFGPLNGVRTALVIGAGLAAVLAAVLGQWAVTLVLGLGIAIHGLGWLYLYRRHQEELKAR